MMQRAISNWLCRRLSGQPGKASFAILYVVGGVLFALCVRVQADSLGAGENLVQNPDFEGHFAQYGPFRTALVAEGWTPWWRPQGHADPAWQNRMPEFKPAAPYLYRVHSGQNAQQLFTAFGTHTGGVYQAAGAQPGSTVRFAIWGHAWAGQSDDPHRSESGGPMQMAIGIDPTGGTSPFSERVIWSEERNPLDVWERFEIEAVAAGSRVTVFTRSAPVYPTKHNDVYWDDAELIVTRPAPAPTGTPRPLSISLGVEPTPMPKGSSEAIPIRVTTDSTPDQSATKTTMPTASDQTYTRPLPSPTPSFAVQTGAICVTVYADRNANRSRDSSEPMIAGVELALSNAEGHSESLSTEDVTACFAGLDTMTYYLVVTAPDGYRVLDSRTWRIQLSGQDAHVLVGLRETHKAAWQPAQVEEAAQTKAHPVSHIPKTVQVVLIVCGILTLAGWRLRNGFCHGRIG